MKPLIYSKTFWVALISGLLDLIIAFQGYPDALTYIAPAQMVLMALMRIVTTRGVYLGLTEP